MSVDKEVLPIALFLFVKEVRKNQQRRLGREQPVRWGNLIECVLEPGREGVLRKKD